jgi:hypothetical protein
MRSVGGVLLALSVTSVCLLGAANSGFAATQGQVEKKQARVITDGRLRPGHFESIRVVGFPGRGVTEVSFFPTAICEDACGARSFRGGRTDAKGAAKFRVRIPGTFIDRRNRSVYFRDGERIEVMVTWEGADNSFDVASAEPQPIIVRVGGSDRG